MGLLDRIFGIHFQPHVPPDLGGSLPDLSGFTPPDIVVRDGSIYLAPSAAPFFDSPRATPQRHIFLAPAGREGSAGRSMAELVQWMGEFSSTGNLTALRNLEATARGTDALAATARDMLANSITDFSLLARQANQHPEAFIALVETYLRHRNPAALAALTTGTYSGISTYMDPDGDLPDVTGGGPLLTTVAIVAHLLGLPLARSPIPFSIRGQLNFVNQETALLALVATVLMATPESIPEELRGTPHADAIHAFLRLVASWDPTNHPLYTDLQTHLIRAGGYVMAMQQIRDTENQLGRPFELPPHVTRLAERVLEDPVLARDPNAFRLVGVFGNVSTSQSVFLRGIFERLSTPDLRLRFLVFVVRHLNYLEITQAGIQFVFTGMRRGSFSWQAADVLQALGEVQPLGRRLEAAAMVWGLMNDYPGMRGAIAALPPQRQRELFLVPEFNDGMEELFRRHTDNRTLELSPIPNPALQREFQNPVLLNLARFGFHMTVIMANPDESWPTDSDALDRLMIQTRDEMVREARLNPLEGTLNLIRDGLLLKYDLLLELSGISKEDRMEWLHQHVTHDIFDTSGDRIRAVEAEFRDWIATEIQRRGSSGGETPPPTSSFNPGMYFPNLSGGTRPRGQAQPWEGISAFGDVNPMGPGQAQALGIGSSPMGVGMAGMSGGTVYGVPGLNPAMTNHALGGAIFMQPSPARVVAPSVPLFAR